MFQTSVKRHIEVERRPGHDDRRKRKKEIMEWLMGKGKKKNVVEEVKESKPYLEEKYTGCYLREKSKLAETVPLPTGVDLNEWLASHSVEFFNQVNLLFGCISEFCTMSSCPVMCAPGPVIYYWYDDKGKKTSKTSIAAPQYVDYVMTFLQKQVYDESVFPSKYDTTFPSGLSAIVRKIFKYLFHVQAHMYCAHFNDFAKLDLHSHLNTVFVSFIMFNQEFNLLEPKETAPLDDLIRTMGLVPAAAQPST